MKNTFVDHWKYYDGWQYTTQCIRVDKNVPWEYNPDMVGWSCWVYPENDEEFEAFIATLPSAEANYRFNGGNCMYTVRIKNKNDADKFARKYSLFL